VALGTHNPHTPGKYPLIGRAMGAMTLETSSLFLSRRMGHTLVPEFGHILMASETEERYLLHEVSSMSGSMGVMTPGAVEEPHRLMGKLCRGDLSSHILMT